jgi:hypothetical protein
MTTYYEVPTSSNNQKFKIALAGVTYTVTLYWCTANNTWVLNIADVNGVDIVTGIPLVANVDLLEPYAHLNFGGKLLALTDDAPDSAPTFLNLGSTGHLYFVSTP